MKAVLYIRVSTAEQEHGPHVQRQACERFAANEGLEITAEFVDHQSGDTELSKRAGLLDAINALQETSSEVLLVYRRGRLSRGSVLAMCVIEHQVTRAGAKIMAAEGSANGDSSEAVLLRRMLDAIAEYELALIRARTRAAVAFKKSRGECVGNVPYGYKRQGKKQLTQCDDEQRTMQIARGLRGNGLAYREIGPALRRLGRLNRKGKQFSVGQVHKMVNAEVH